MLSNTTNAYTGGTILRNGELSFSVDGNLGGASTPITFAGGILQYTGTNTDNISGRTINAATFNGGFDITQGGGLIIVPQALGGAGNLTKLGAGQLWLTGANNYSGTTLISAGAIQVGNNSAGANIGTGTITDNASLFFSNTDTITVNAVITGSGLVRTLSTGTLILGGTNNYSGGTQFTGGTIKAAGLANLGTGSFFFDEGTFQYLPSSPFDLTARTTILGSGGGTFDTNGNTVTFANSIGSNAGGAFTKVGAGKITFNVSNSYVGPTTVSGGSLVTNANFTNGTLTVNTAAFAQVASRATSNTIAGATLVPAAALNGTGVLDLTNNALLINYTGASPLSTIAGDLKTGYNSGSWNGVGIQSSSAAAVAISANIHKTALGFGEASTLGIGTFAGHTIDNTTLIVAYALAGDANLDGQVNTSDFTAMANHFQASTNLWTSGDFNYDGKVNALDFNQIATNFGATFSDLPVLGSLVPEPGVVALAIVAPFLTRRRRSR